MFERFTDRARRVVVLAQEEARMLNHNYIGTEHILLGLIHEGEGVAAQVLVKLGADLNRVRQQVIQLLSGYQGKEAATAGGPAEGTPSTSLVLDQFGRNLTQAARENKLDPVIGREKEIERVMQVLSRRTKNNPVLVGEPGVGKTAVVEGLAQAIVKGEAPGPPRARSTRPRSSSRCSPAVSCRRSARPRWTSTASTWRRTPPWSGASSRSRSGSPRSLTRSRSSRAYGTDTRRTTGSPSPTGRWWPRPRWRTATSPTGSCRTRRST